MRAFWSVASPARNTFTNAGRHSRHPQFYLHPPLLSSLSHSRYHQSLNSACPAVFQYFASSSVSTPGSHTDHGMAEDPTPTKDSPSQSCNRIPTTDGELPDLPPNKDILASAIRMTNITRFIHLLSHAKALITHHGPHTTLPATSVFTRSLKPPRPAYPSSPSLKFLALSLAAAQDSTYSAQPPSRTKDDLDFFTLLWDSSIAVLEEILSRGSLPQESFGWGIFGLAAGYMHPPSPPHDLSQQNIFMRNKARLHAALCMMPSLEGPAGNGYRMSGRTTTEGLTRARRDIHTLGHVLLYEFRKGGWKRVRWGNAVAIAERWVGTFGLRGREFEGFGRVVAEREDEERGEGKKETRKRVTFEFP